ncbi:hypothetical protein C8F04DRAFT_1174817 [Mycena alexandri]|uniref:Uncharacterized protein n=1 Tax=Mycena alexandri TaxID=1745969 RepID=A0AAD6TDC7_9AGAR|nr:hypothetical protein C8F04DRAFT_1174817 [Mycena alexandri]
MRLIGELKYGKYADSFDEIHSDVRNRYQNEVNINDAIAGDQNHNIAIDVADHQFPFQNELAADIFGQTLADAKTAEIIPLQLGVLPAEWEANGYPESETVKVGRKDVGRSKTAT